MLLAYHNGTFDPEHLPLDELNAFTQRKNTSPTFGEVYERWFQDKFEDDRSRDYSESTVRAAKLGYKHCSAIQNRPIKAISYSELQDVIDGCDLSYATKSMIITVMKGVWGYAEKFELCEKNPTVHLAAKVKNDPKHGTAFTEEEIRTLWEHKDNEIVELILIMIYSGYRISAYKTLEVNLEDRFFKGGVKTAAGKGRIVPIHSKIYPLVKERMKRDGALIYYSVDWARRAIQSTLSSLGMEHTPHDTRHTFSALCERYGVNEADRKRMLGHSFGADITNSVYGHRTLEDLREQIEKICV